MSSLETSWVMQVIAQWLRAPGVVAVCPVELDPGRLDEVLEKNRLLPFFHQLPVTFAEAPEWAKLKARLSFAYQRSLMQGLVQLKAGHDLMECLTQAGIKSLAVRGPFLAEDVYGDLAVRMSADVDILVSCRDRRRAWQVCQAQGYRSVEWECPLWPWDQHRIHWRLQRKGEPVICELHWAVEPVYGVMTFDYEALVREHTPTQMFLLLCLHVGGHIGDACPEFVDEIPLLESAVKQGMVFRWLDVALFLRKYGPVLDWAEIDRQARDRRVGASLVLCLAGVRDWFGMAIPAEAEQRMPGWASSVERQRSAGLRRGVEQWWSRRARRVLGLETALPDVLYFLWPHAWFFGPAQGVELTVRRVGHYLKAVVVMFLSVMRYVGFVGITALRRGALSACSPRYGFIPPATLCSGGTRLAEKAGFSANRPFLTRKAAGGKILDEKCCLSPVETGEKS